jgi:lactoylglutathione lyase
MTIHHIGMYVEDIEKARDFFAKYFGAEPGEGYCNPKKGFRSFFLRFGGGAGLELMHKEQMETPPKAMTRTGYIHLSFSVGTKEKVDELTERLRKDGFTVAGEPRTTGDGYYESCVLDAEGNQIEITV